LRTPFYLLYTILSLILYIIAIPIILYLSFKSKYKESLPARFFLQKTPPFKKEGIWFHACSLGEAKALEPLIKNIEKAAVNISVITHTGFSAASSSYKNANVRYLPYELFLPFWQNKQRILIVLEAEFWYMLFVTAFSKGTRLVLLNARISERSYPKYLKMAWFYKKLFACVDTIYVQSLIDKERFESLGARNIKVIGNIKLAQEIKATTLYNKPKGLTVVGGSTHPREEKLLIEAFLEFRKEHLSHLVIVPRHPERFKEVGELMQGYAEKYNLSFSHFSKSTALDADMILVDEMGELNNIYQVSDIAVLGGGFAAVGGHNPLEPIAFGCKLISGKQIFNQKELFSYVKDAQIIEEDELLEALHKALTMPPAHIDERVNLDEINQLIKEYDFE
jgi:3-deoxy-D-manno-octulosonic-acid transferase